ncbi:hypothetical protein ACV4WP_28245 [Pseudomonas aeruginosa]|uniref:hypothetical protein n=1 Tax=Pseudomonas aeruginosa TaxID=287 RepID=UPI001243EF23|nr:hypothetical protein [Pseudomonas aeruginosa]KAB0773154.1 hypothetical protein F7P00_22435 [Pseudomonas aeruginosa]
MLAYLLILGMAYVVAYSVGVSKPSYGRAAAGFTLAVMVAWIFGSILVAQGAAFLDGLLGLRDGGSSDPKQFVLYLFQRGCWWAVIGAGIGVFRARRRIHHQGNASTSGLPKWEGKTALAVILFGVMLAVAIPAYKDYTKRLQKPWEFFQEQQSAVAQVRTSPVGAAPSAAPLANSYPENLPGGQLGQPTEISQADWEHGDIAVPQAATHSDAAANPMSNEHLRRIYAAHPDADAIFASAEFRAWMARYPAYQRIAAEGTTQDVIEMFTAYKNQRQSNPFENPDYGK